MTGVPIYTTGAGQITTLSSPDTVSKITIKGALTLGDKPANNSSSDLEDWEVNEMRKFIKWFVNMHHPEAIEQFLAIRKIERANEEQARLQAEQKWMEREVELRKRIREQALANISEQQAKTIWGKMKELAGYK